MTKPPRKMNRYRTVLRFLTDTDLSHAEARLMVLLTLRSQDHGPECRKSWWKQQALAEQMHVSERYVRTLVADLTSKNRLQVWRLSHGNLYRIPPTWDEVEHRGVSVGLVSID